MEAVIVASGDVPNPPPDLARADLVIAADGGVANLELRGRRPDVIVGDLDSADPAAIARLEAGGTRVERHPADKDASDTALAVRTAIAAGATGITLVGTLGGRRLDHAVAGLLLLADPALAARDARLVHGPDTVRLVRGGDELRLGGRPGDVVTLLPVGGEATGVTTRGLRWPLGGDDLPMGTTRGLSNEIVEAPASVRLVAGSLLVIEHAQQEGDRPA